MANLFKWGGGGISVVVGPTMITFTIEGVEYQAEEGMTLGEWVASSYNTAGFYNPDGTTQVKTADDSEYVCTQDTMNYPADTSYALSDGSVLYTAGSHGGGSDD